MRQKHYTKYVEEIFDTENGTGSWFGYYNYDPISADGSKLLGNRARQDAVRVEKGMVIDLGYYDIPSGKWHKIGESDSFNWPQGAMMQWMPGEGNENCVIYNTSKNNHNIARIVNIRTGVERDLDWSVYGITPDGKKSIALDMERQHWCRGYHYESVIRPELDVRVLEGDGIFEIDMEKNTRRLLIDIHDIISMDKEDYYDIAKHWIEHIMISPNGKRFCFLHRYSIGNVSNYETRLFIADIDGSNLQLIDDWRKKDRSHFGWNGDDAFAIYCYINNKHQRMVDCANNYGKPPALAANKHPLIRSAATWIRSIVPAGIKKEIKILKNGQQTYYEYFTRSQSGFELHSELICRNFDIDGHPSFTKDGKYMVTDSYPDCHKMQRLIVYNMESRKSIIVARIHAALHSTPASCDLHPKLCADNNFLTVDSAYNGQHHMMIFQLNWELIKRAIG